MISLRKMCQLILTISKVSLSTGSLWDTPENPFIIEFTRIEYEFMEATAP